MNPLFVGIDVSSKNNIAYLMKPDGSKHSSFSVQNNLGGAFILARSVNLSDDVSMKQGPAKWVSQGLGRHC